MNKEERQALIRGLYLAKAKGMAFRASGEAKKPVPEKPKVTRLVIGWPQIIPDTKRAPAWMKAQDAKTGPTVRIERTERIAPLTQIARKLPAKLPVLTFCPKTRHRL